jgi:pimeloyl-ACP methyl ester carboxylesterase
MASEVILPKVDMDMATGRISRWFVAEGDKVQAGDVLFEIETDKAAMEVDAPASGILRGVSAESGAEVPVGSVVAWIYGEGESFEAKAAPDPDPAVSPSQPAGGAKAPEPAAPDAPSEPEVSPPAQISPQPPTGEPARAGGVRATPLARRLARERGIALESVSGSGPRGRIMRRDLPAEAENRRNETAATTRLPAPGNRAAAAEGAGLNAVWLRQGEGKPVVMLHGFASDLNSWRHFLAGAAFDAPVLAIDLPCHGASPRDVPRDFEDLCERVEQAVVSAGIGPSVLVGHSLGGAVVARLAERGLVDARALALIAPAGLGPAIDGRFTEGFVKAIGRAAIGAWFGELVHDASLLPAAFVTATEQQSEDRDLRDSQALLAGRLFPGGTQTMSITESLSGLALPCRIVVGTGDRIIPSEYALRVPGHVGVHRLDRCGHMPQVEHRETVRRIIDEVIRLAA